MNSRVFSMQKIVGIDTSYTSEESDDQSAQHDSKLDLRDVPDAAAFSTPPLKSRPTFAAPTSGLSNHTSHQQRPSIYLPLITHTEDKDDKQFSFSASLPTPAPPKSPSAINPMYGEHSGVNYMNYSPPSTVGAANSYAPTTAAASPTNYATPSSPTIHHRSSPSRILTSSPTQPITTSRRPFAISQTDSIPPFLAVLPPSLLQLLDTPSAWLTYYFFANLGLTLYNKFVLVKFPFPWTMTGIHCLACTLGCLFLYQQNFFKPARITQREQITLLLFSALYALNIAISNVSLNLASVPFHQVVRATTPIFTMLINVFFLKKTYSSKVVISLIPVVMGVGLATFGDYYTTAAGFFLTVLGAVLASLKGVATNMLLVGSLRLHPLDLLLRMSPLAFVQCVCYAYVTGELTEVRAYGALEMTSSRAIALILNGAIAFFLNVVSFSANKKTSALTMTVAGNVKQCLTIILAVWLFNVAVSFTNSLGISLTLIGGAWYARENYLIKQKKGKQELSPLVEALEKTRAEKASHQRIL